MTESETSDSEIKRLPTKIPRSTQPLVRAEPAVVAVVGENATSWRPLLYVARCGSQPANGTTARPLVASSVNALKVPAAGVHAQPWPNVDVPSTRGAAGSGHGP